MMNLFGASQLALEVKNPLSNAGYARCRFNPWVRKIPWRSRWHPGILAWRILWTEEAGGLQFIGLQRAGQDRSVLARMYSEPIYRAGIEMQTEKGLVDMVGRERVGGMEGEGGRN